MVLVDTSVWIRFLANRTPYATTLDALLDRDEVAGHELVYGELLIGDRAGRAKLLGAYEEIRQASMVPHSDVVAFVRSRALCGRGMGWIDVHLLASAIVEQLPLWTADSRLFAVAKELGVAYEKSSPSSAGTLPFSCPFSTPKSGKWQHVPAQSEGRRSPHSSSDGARCGSAKHIGAKRG